MNIKRIECKEEKETTNNGIFTDKIFVLTGTLSKYTRSEASEIIEKLGIPKHIFPEIVKTGTTKGMILPEICEELGIESAPVCAIGSHYQMRSHP